MEWNVPPHKPVRSCGTSAATRSSISRAALFVKVSRRMFEAGMPFSMR